MAKRKASDGKQVGLKKPFQNWWFSTQLPEVSMKVMIPLITTMLAKAAMK